MHICPEQGKLRWWPYSVDAKGDQRNNYIEILHSFFYGNIAHMYQGGGRAHMGVAIYVIVMTWARVICLQYTHEHEGYCKNQPAKYNTVRYNLQIK